ncbi:cobalamin B12-binding domain-containing protein [Chloroflexota bacterium]
MADEKKIRVLLAKTGLDGHDRGVKILTMGLRDEGMEVIYTGIRQTPESVAHIAVQEDIDVVGLSSLSGAHKYLFPRVVELLREQGADDTLVIGGGIIPEEDIPFLREKGIKAVFGPGTSIKTVADFIRENKPMPRSKL